MPITTEDPRRRPPLDPLDQHNQRLRANVHPNDWINPTPSSHYHLVVVGAGTAGLVAAAGAAGLGAKVALVPGLQKAGYPRIYAAGDICSRYKFTHAADALARIVNQNALFLSQCASPILTTAPWQLDPLPAVQPKQWRPVWIDRFAS